MKNTIKSYILTRELSQAETAFLAWFFVTVGRRDIPTYEAHDCLREWEEMTGNELPEDFINCVVRIHDECAKPKE